MIPKVVFIGGIESGKTSLISSLFDDSATSVNFDNEICYAKIHEMLPGREAVDYEVLELPKITFSDFETYRAKENVYRHLESADVIIVVLMINDGTISFHEQYLHKLFSSVTLKPTVKIIFALSKADYILTPLCAARYQISRSKHVGLKEVSDIISKVSTFYDVFSKFVDFDSSLCPSSFIPFSCALEWNINEIRYQIWDGIVASLNSINFDANLPTVVFAGKTGSGKTSTINLLWDKKLAVDRALSCTKFPAVMHIDDYYNGKTVSFNLVDLPGIAESLDANITYKRFYYQFIKQAKVQVCLTQADRRAYKQDELFYNDLIRNDVLSPEKNIIIGINQADLLFKTKEHYDGIDLHAITCDNPIIQEKIEDCFKSVFANIFQNFKTVSLDSVHIYSIYQNWNVKELKNKIYHLLFN